jgi:hypothetical protein
LRTNDWPFLRDCHIIRGQQRGDGTKRMYQWISGRARLFRSGTSGQGTSRTVRTEVTVQREAMTLLVGDAAAVGFDTCPLCGTKLAPAEAEQVRLRLPKGPLSA